MSCAIMIATVACNEEFSQSLVVAIRQVEWLYSKVTAAKGIAQ